MKRHDPARSLRLPAIRRAMLVLALGLTAPASAQGSQRPAGGASMIDASPAFRTHAAAADTALKAGDWATAESELAAAEAVAANDDERYRAASMRLTIETHKRSMPGIIRAADALIANPRTPPDLLGGYNFQRGQASFNVRKFADAVAFLLKARKLGFLNSETATMLALAYVETGNVRDSVAEIGTAIDAMKATGGKPPEDWYSFAVAKSDFIGDRTATAAWMMRQLADYPTVQNWRKLIAIYRVTLDKAHTPLDRAQKLDLFRLMRFTGALTDQTDYFDYAAFADAAGLPWEAAAVIDECRKAGRIPAGNADFAKLSAAATSAIARQGPLDRVAAQSGSATAIAGAADTRLASADYARALELYDAALAKGGVDADPIHLDRGVALVRLGRKDEARAAFMAVRAPPLSDIARFWVVWLGLPPL